MRSARPRTGLLSWTRTPEHTPTEPGAHRYSASPEEMASTVKAAARLYGARLVGIAPMNESYVNLQVPRQNEKEKDKEIAFEDVDVTTTSNPGLKTSLCYEPSLVKCRAAASDALAESPPFPRLLC